MSCAVCSILLLATPKDYMNSSVFVGQLNDWINVHLVATAHVLWAISQTYTSDGLSKFCVRCDGKCEFQCVM